MKKKWVIREALLSDAVSLQACMQSAYSSYQDRMCGKRLPPMDLNYASEISDFPTWVAEFDNLIVGGLTMMFEKDFATIANIGVHSEFQGQGLGGGLMEFAESQASEKSYSEIRLATHVLLRENVSLYLHLGWTEFSRGDDKVQFKKRIVRKL